MIIDIKVIRENGKAASHIRVEIKFDQSGECFGPAFYFPVREPGEEITFRFD